MTAPSAGDAGEQMARARAAHLAGRERVRIETSAAGIDVRVRAASGAWLRIHSQRNPAAEAEAWVDRALAGKAVPPVAVVFGLGLGHIAEALAARRRDIRIVAFELEPGLVLSMLERGPMRALIARGQLTVAFGPTFDLSPLRWPDEALAQTPLVLLHPVLGAERPDALQAARAAWRQTLFEQQANRTAADAFARLYIEHTLTNAAALASEGDVGALDGAGAGAPIVLCAPGPSLDRLLPELRAYRERAIFVALDTALRPLLTAGIEPDFVVAVDPSLMNGRHFLGLPRHPQTWLVTDPSLDPRAMRPFTDRTFLYRVGDNHPWPWLKSLGIDRTELRVWGSVVTAGCDFALRLGGDPIIFAGVDLAYTGGQPYCRGTTFEIDWAAQQARDGIGLDELWRRRLQAATLEEPDVYDHAVGTAPHLVAFRNRLRTVAETSGRRFINATRGGILHGGGIELRSLPDALGHARLAGRRGLAWQDAYDASRPDRSTAEMLAAVLSRGGAGASPWRQWAQDVPGLEKEGVERAVRAALTDLAHRSRMAVGAVPRPTRAVASPADRDESMTSYPEWIDVPFDPAVFRAKEPMRWEVSESNVQTLSYLLVGKTMTLSFKIVRSTLTGSPANEVYIRIPGGYTARRSMVNAVWTATLSAREMGYAVVHPGLDSVVVFRSAEQSYVPDDGMFFVFGQITFEVA
jgi:hypothetical protein